jgi:hypothetical protein
MLNNLLLFSLLLQSDAGLLFRSDKIFTVLTVVLIIFSGMILFLWNLDRRISRMEQKEKESKKL